MAHHVYQTNALILRGASISDGDRFISVFTRELGLVRAIAKSARRERSKLRYSLQDYSFGNVALVRGREVWRVTGAKEDFSIYHELRGDSHKLNLFARVISLLSRLLQGEEKNEHLFDIMKSFVDYLRAEKIEESNLKALECLIVLRMLHSLGYVADIEEIFDSSEINDDILSRIHGKELRYVELINQSIKESHL